MVGFPVELAGLAKGEPAEDAPDRDIEERIALALAPGTSFELLRHDRHGALHARELLIGPRLAALALLAQGLVAHQEPGIEHAVVQPLPAVHRDAFARLV